MKYSAFVSMLLIIAFVGLAVFVLLPGDGEGVLRTAKAERDEMAKKLALAEARITDLEKKMELLSQVKFQPGAEPEKLLGRIEKLEKKHDKIQALAAVGKIDTATPKTMKEKEVAVANESRTDMNMAQLKSAVIEQLKEEEKEEQRVARKKKAKQWGDYIAKEFKGQMDNFGPFAEKIGLSASQEEDIRVIVQDSFDRISKVLEEAWSQDEGEIDWGPVKKEIQEIEDEAASRIEPFVTEEQGKALYEYFHD